MTYYNHLSEKERDFIFFCLLVWKKQKEIAKELGRNPWTISREIKRNSVLVDPRFNNNPKMKMIKGNYVYLPNKAHLKYLTRKSDSSKKKPLKVFAYIRLIKFCLMIGWSPEIISWYMKAKWIGNISHEAIYQFIYNKDFKYLKLWEFLPLKRKKRKSKSWRWVRRSNIPNRVSISQRPEEANLRDVVWYWESDTIEWHRKKSCLHVSVERATRLVRIRKMSAKKALYTVNAMINIFSDIPKELLKWDTPDNWSEFTKWELVSEEIQIPFFFTHPYSSWEKWTVERINWFIRRFFPKWTNFDLISEEEIQYVEDWINNRPMKCLNFRTPNEKFQECLNSSF